MDNEQRTYWGRVADFGLEYRNDRQANENLGVTMEDYIRSRCVDEGMVKPSAEQIEKVRETIEQRIEVEPAD